jgi:hypothetical protein
MKMSAGKNGVGGGGMEEGGGLLVMEDKARYGVCSSLPGRGLQRNVVYSRPTINRPRIWMSPNAGEGESCGVSANEYSCTQGPK